MEAYQGISKERKLEILDEFELYIKERTNHHLGYPYNLEFEYEDLSRFFKYSINNLGDPFNPSNYGVHSRQFELEVIKFFSKLWNIGEEDYWAYVTNSGTEGMSLHYYYFSNNNLSSINLLIYIYLFIYFLYYFYIRKFTINTCCS